MACAGREEKNHAPLKDRPRHERHLDAFDAATGQRDGDGFFSQSANSVNEKKKYRELTASQAMAPKKEKKLSYHENRKYENTKKLRWRNHYKFVGVLPDFRGFEKLK